MKIKQKRQDKGCLFRVRCSKRIATISCVLAETQMLGESGEGFTEENRGTLMEAVGMGSCRQADWK